MSNRISPARGLPTVFQISGSNPAGQPQKKPGTVLREILAMPPSDLSRKAIAEALGLPSYEDVPLFDSKLRRILWTLVELADRGDMEAAREILDRIYPKPRRMEVSGPGGGPLRSRVQTGPPTAEEIASGDALYAALAGEEKDLEEEEEG